MNSPTSRSRAWPVRRMRLGDVADVIEDHQPLIGDATREGERSLMLVIERFPDADVAAVTEDVEAALQAMSAGLTGISVDTDVYRPASYLESAPTGSASPPLRRRGAHAARRRPAHLVLADRRSSPSARSPPRWSPPSTCCASGRSPLTTMTVLGLAAVAALVVDDVVGDMSAVNTRVRERRAAGEPALVALIGAAVVGRRGPLAYATVIAFVALVPLLFLTGPAGAFARPALLTFVLAALASFLVALVVTPVLAVLLARHGEGEHRGRPVQRPGARRATTGWRCRSVGRVVPAVLGLAVLLGLVRGRAAEPALGLAPARPRGPQRAGPVRGGRRARRWPRWTASPASRPPNCGSCPASRRSARTSAARSAPTRWSTSMPARSGSPSPTTPTTTRRSTASGRRSAAIRACAARCGRTPTTAVTEVSASTGDDLVVRVYGRGLRDAPGDRRGRPAGAEDGRGRHLARGRAAGDPADGVRAGGPGGGAAVRAPAG